MRDSRRPARFPRPGGGASACACDPAADPLDRDLERLVLIGSVKELALLDRSENVTLDHLRAAVAVWDYCAASAAYIFGDIVGDLLVDKILDALRDADDDGLTRTGIRAVVGGHVYGHEIDAAVRYLLARGLVEEHLDPTTPRGGRRPHRYTLGSRSKPREGWEQTSGRGGFAPQPTRFPPHPDLRGCLSHRDRPEPGCRYCQAR